MASQDLPAPLVPADVDLRSYDWFPFFHKRLRQSAFWKRASDLACRISVDLWSEAYEQVPAGSIPDDHYLLSEWAGFGRRDLKGWLAVKDEVLGAWTLCSDGRWYHPTLCEVAAKAWIERRLHLWARECDRLRKENARRAKSGLVPLEMPAKPSDSLDADVKTAKPSVGAAPTSESHSSISESASSESDAASSRRPAETPDFPAEIALKGTGTRILSSSLRSEEFFIDPSPPKPDERPPKPKPERRNPFPDDAFEGWYSGYPLKVGRAAAEKAFEKVRKADRVPFEMLVAGRDRYVRTKPSYQDWCHPASWLNGERWCDQPEALAGFTPPLPSTPQDPRVDLGGGISATYSTIRRVWEKGRWPADWGPAPDQPGCRIPPDDMSRIMAKAAA